MMLLPLVLNTLHGNQTLLVSHTLISISVSAHANV